MGLPKGADLKVAVEHLGVGKQTTSILYVELRARVVSLNNHFSQISGDHNVLPVLE